MAYEADLSDYKINFTAGFGSADFERVAINLTHTAERNENDFSVLTD